MNSFYHLVFFPCILIILQFDQVTNLHFRGARVWLAVMEYLLTKGMRNAENVRFLYDDLSNYFLPFLIPIFC